MDTPTYRLDIIIGGSGQTTQTKIGGVLPKTIILRQSGSIILTAKDGLGVAFDLSGLGSTEVFAKPFNSSEVPVSLGNGVISGASNEIFTITWVRDLMPASWSSFAFDRDGTIVLYTEMQETGTADFFQWSTRVNVDDGDYVGDASTLPETNLIFYYNPLWAYDNVTTDADPGAENFRLNNNTLSAATELYISDTNQSTVDFAASIQNLSVGTEIYISNPNVRQDSALFIVSGAITDNVNYTTVPLTFVSSGSVSFSNGTILSFGFNTGPQAVAAGADNNQVGTTYTLALTDKNNVTVGMDNALANVATIPLNSAVAFPIGTKIPVVQDGLGATTVTGDTGVTVNGVSAGSVVVSSQYNGLLLHKRATNTWSVAGA